MTEMPFYLFISLWVNELYEPLGQLLVIQPLLRKYHITARNISV